MPSASGSVLLNGTSTNVGTTLTVTATQTSQNVTANTSVITLTYTIASGRSWGAFYTPSNTYMTPTIDGVEGTRTKVTNPADLNAGQSAVVLTTTHTVNHNSDGTKTVGISVFYDDRPGGGATTKTVSTFYLTLDTIPRASSLSVTASQTMGTSYRFTISRASSAFRHKITYAFGNTSGTVLDTTTSDVTTKDWTPPTSLASQSVVTGGSKSATITYYLYTYSGGTQIGSVSSTATLSIPSADTLNAVTASQTMGTAYTFTCGQNAPNYTHKLNWSFGSASGTDNTAFTTSKSFTPATSLGSQIPSSNSGTIYYTITTYNGSTIVGTSSAKSATLSIPSGAEPAFSFSASVTNGNSLGVPIVGYSTVAWSTTGVSTKYGATVASYSFSFAGVSSTDATKSGVKLISGSAGGTSYTPTMTVTDSRGKKTTHTASAVTVYTYSAPVIVSSYAYRSDANGNRKDDGTYIAYFSNVKTDYTCGGHNTVVAEHRYRPTNGSWDSWYGHYINQQILSADWSITQSYQFEIRVRDSLGSTKSVAYTIPTASVAFNIKEGGKGAALFGYAQENGVFEVNGKVKPTEGILLHNDELAIRTPSYTSGVPSKKIVSSGVIDAIGWYNIARKKLNTSNQIYPFTASLKLLRHYNNFTPEAYEFSLVQSWTTASITQLSGYYNGHQIDRVGLLVDTVNHYVYIALHSSMASSNTVLANIEISDIYSGGNEWERVFEYYPTANYAICELETRQNGLSAPNIYVGNHSSAVGTYLYASKDMKVASQTWGQGAGITLGRGTWVFNASAEFANNANGDRLLRIYGTSDYNLGNSVSYRASTSSNASRVNMTRVLNVTSADQVDMYSWAYQSSGTTLDVSMFVSAIRIS